jgi:hypothetical protein
LPSRIPGVCIGKRVEKLIANICRVNVGNRIVVHLLRVLPQSLNKLTNRLFRRAESLFVELILTLLANTASPERSAAFRATHMAATVLVEIWGNNKILVLCANTSI